MGPVSGIGNDLLLCGPRSDRESPSLLFVIKAMFNLNIGEVAYKKRGPLTPAFWNHCAVKVQQTFHKLLEIFVKTNTDTAVLGNTDTEYRYSVTDINKYRKKEYRYRLE